MNDKSIAAALRLSRSTVYSMLLQHKCIIVVCIFKAVTRGGVFDVLRTLSKIKYFNFLTEFDPPEQAVN